MPVVKLFRITGCLLGTVLSFFVSQAQGDMRLKFNHLSPKSGLSGSYARKVVQDPYGFMWIGTEDGLNRYDGRDFDVYNKGLAPRRSLAGLDVTDLLLDTTRHLIWAIMSYNGISAVDYITGNTVYNYFQTGDAGTADILFTSMTLCGDQLYLGSTNGIFILNANNKKLRKATLDGPVGKQYSQLAVDNILADRAGRLWLFCRNVGVLLFRANDLRLLDMAGKPIPTDRSASDLLFYHCTLLQDGRILSAGNKGLQLFSANGNDRITVARNPFPDIPASHGMDIYACCQDRKGDIWFSASNHLVKIDRRSGGYSFIREHTSQSDLNWVNAVYDIYFDRNNDVWLGCQQGLAYAENRPSSFLSIHQSYSSGISIRHAYFLNPVSDSLVYCCAQDGLFRVSLADGSIQSLDTKRPYYHAFIDPFRNLIVSNTEGAFILKDGRFTGLGKFYPEFGPLKTLSFNSHCYIGDSVIVFGTENERGLVVWNFRSRKASIIDHGAKRDSLKENVINAIYKDSHGKIWILGDKSVSILDYETGKIQYLNTYNASNGRFYSVFFDICCVKDNYYLASYGAGVLVLDSNRRFVREISAKDGLSTNSVYKIIPYKDSLLFVTSNNGLSSIDLKRQYGIKTYFESDGLHSGNFEENSGAIRNNIIYAGGAEGFTRINPSLFPVSLTPPHLYTWRVNIETQSGRIDSSDILLRTIQIPDNALQTTIYFSAISYPNPSRTSFSYKIKELKEDWISIGSQNFVNLIGLGPGKYTLQVRAANEDGIWSDTKELTLTFLPKWYQTLWFKLLVIAAIAGLLYTLYRYRIGQIRQQQQIRKDIASDLHDDIGSTLNTVKIFTHLAQRDKQNEGYLASIEESLGDAAMGLRDMIWVLDDSGDTIRELAERIKKFAGPIATVQQIQFECAVEEEDTEHQLSKPQKRNLLLIAKETINNSIKYAECSRIRVTLGRQGSKLALTILDDGKGFDSGSTTEGNGLRNILQRARQIHFEAAITSSPGKGTFIKVTEI